MVTTAVIKEIAIQGFVLVLEVCIWYHNFNIN